MPESKTGPNSLPPHDPPVAMGAMPFAPWVGLFWYLAIVRAMPSLFSDGQGLILLLPLSVPLLLGALLGIVYVLAWKSVKGDLPHLLFAILGVLCAVIVPLLYDPPRER